MKTAFILDRCLKLFTIIALSLTVTGPAFAKGGVSGGGGGGDEPRILDVNVNGELLFIFCPKEQSVISLEKVKSKLSEEPTLEELRLICEEQNR